MVVAQHWPGSLILVMALNLPLLMGFFPNKFHGFFTLLSLALLNGGQHVTFVARATLATWYICCPEALISCGVLSQRCWVVSMLSSLLNGPVILLQGP